MLEDDVSAKGEYFFHVFFLTMLMYLYDLSVGDVIDQLKSRQCRPRMVSLRASTIANALIVTNAKYVLFDVLS